MQAPVSTFMMMRLAQDNSIMDNIDYKAKVGFVPAGDGALKKDIPAAESGAEACVDETGVIKNDPALKPVIKIDTALKQAAVCGETLPSIKEFPEKKPAAPAASAWHCARRRLPTHSVTPSRVRRVGRRRLEGVSRGDGRPGGEHLPAEAHAGIAGTRESYRRALPLTL